MQLDSWFGLTGPSCIERWANATPDWQASAVEEDDLLPIYPQYSIFYQQMTKRGMREYVYAIRCS